MPDQQPLPVSGYTAQSDEKVALVNEFKRDEERLLRKLDKLVAEKFYDAQTLLGIDGKGIDQRWLAIARSHLQEGFMALNRAVFQPQRIKLPKDENK